MMCSYPKSIQKVAPVPQTREERKRHHLWMYFGMLLSLAVYGSVSAVSSGVTGFEALFLTDHFEWLVFSFVDLFLLDICLLQKLGATFRCPAPRSIRTISWATGSKGWRSRSRFWLGRW